MAVYINDFGVCWGVVCITHLSERTGKPTYGISPTQTPWYDVNETSLKPATDDDLWADAAGWGDGYWQHVHGFTPDPAIVRAAYLNG